MAVNLWNYAYRHWLRDATEIAQARVLASFAAAGLDPIGESDEHEAILRTVLHPCCLTLRSSRHNRTCPKAI
jgi:hypothetical protein